MANGRNKSRKKGSGRDPGGFVALPWSVLDCPAFLGLSHPARSLLLELARQFVFDNNGRLLAVKGHRPNKASWYAVTWQTLDKIAGFDLGATETFVRGAYQKNASLRPSPGVGKPSIAPSPGVGSAPPTPSPGAIRSVFVPPSTPSHGNHLEMPSVGSQMQH